jgi:hypothetical protein
VYDAMNVLFPGPVRPNTAMNKSFELDLSVSLVLSLN